MIGVVLLLLVYVVNAEYSYTTKYIDVPLDHFDYTTNKTFKLRYLINDTYHAPKGPIFFYTGNEGDINMFAQNSGFINDIADQFSALIVFAEHRYYGTSLPFGNLSYSSPQYLGYLSSEQALADYVYLINDLQKQRSVSNDLEKLPVVVFGGSYGGMLAAWMRMKYPASVAGAIASSAPIWQFKGLIPCENFNRITTNVYSSLGGSKCSKIISGLWKTIRDLTKTDEGKLELSKLWNLCNPLKTNGDIEILIDWLEEILTNMAMVNYPYPTSFLVSLPAYPVREFCNKVNNYIYKTEADVVKGIAAALQIYTNYTQKTICNDIKKTADNLGDAGWDFQSCTEIIIPMCSTDMDMFESEEWDFAKFSDECFKKFGVRPRSEDVPLLHYGGKDIKAASNIVFSNGLIDPWSSGGVLSNISSKLLAIVLPDAAHHLDLRGQNELDTDTVKAARQFHIRQIRKWLNEYYFEHLSSSWTSVFYNASLIKFNY